MCQIGFKTLLKINLKHVMLAKYTKNKRQNDLLGAIHS